MKISDRKLQGNGNCAGNNELWSNERGEGMGNYLDADNHDACVGVLKGRHAEAIIYHLWAHPIVTRTDVCIKNAIIVYCRLGTGPHCFAGMLSTRILEGVTRTEVSKKVEVEGESASRTRENTLRSSEYKR